MSDNNRVTDCTLVQGADAVKQIVIALVGNPSSGKSSLYDSILRLCDGSNGLYRGYQLKVTELASLSGFNSLVSFSMAFRLYMNENPSDWIRKERTRKTKSGLMSSN